MKWLTTGEKDDKIRFGMCYKHIPKEYLRRKIIRIFRPNVFGSYLIVFFRLRLASPRSRIESGTSTLDVPENLYRITTVFRIRYCRIHLCLLCFSILEEVYSNLWEQCVRQYIFILLDPLFAFFAECI